MLLGDLLSQRKQEQHKGVTYRGTFCSYGELYRQAASLAKAVRQLAGGGNQVGVILDNSPQFLQAYFAITLAGKTIVPLKSGATPAEIARITASCEIRLLLTDTRHIEKLSRSEVVFAYQLRCYALDEGKAVTLGENKKLVPLSETERTHISAEDTALMMHTSGTTSDPKIVMLSHNNLIENARAVCRSLQLRESDRTLIFLPMHLSSANIQMLTHLYLGADLVILDGIFTWRHFLKVLAREQITTISCVTFAVKCLIENSSGAHLPCLRQVGVGGGFVPASLLALGMEKFPHTQFVHYYGQTEAAPRITQHVLTAGEENLASIGKALDNLEVKIADAMDEPLPPHTEGEILARGPNIMKGYYHNSEASAKTLRGGWLHTGDIGYMDEQGYVYIKGRSKNIIISNGMNIYPEEVEEVLTAFPGVKEALVYGAPHPLYQEVPKAKLVLAQPIDLPALQRYCLERLSAYKAPAEYQICDELPKTDTGKLKRKGVVSV